MDIWGYVRVHFCRKPSHGSAELGWDLVTLEVTFPRVPPRPYAKMLLLLSDSLPIFKARLSTITSAQRTEQPHVGLFLALSQN